MWKKERRKTIIVNCIVGLLFLLVAGGLLYALKEAKQHIAAEDAQLRADRTNQVQELNDARQENLTLLQNAYDADMETVARFLPGIVCWGDSLTAGSSGDISYPQTLQKYINAYLCDIYDLRYSVPNPESYTRVNWADYSFSIPVVNMGGGQDNVATTLGRAGVLPYVVSQSFVIPAGTESVTISLEAQDARTVAPLTAGNAGVNPVTIAGVEGTLVRVSDPTLWGVYRYQFTRLEAGEETPVEKGTEILTDCRDKYSDYIHIIWVGTYGDIRTPEKLVSDVKSLLARQTQNTDRYLVIGPCTTGGSWSEVSVTALNSIDTAMLQAFGDHYVNLRKYLIEDGLRDAGLTSTAFSLPGTIPSVFCSNAGGADMNSVAYQLIGKLVFTRMNQLGYFNEVQEELNLNAITQELLKNDPTYFDRLLALN